MQDFDVNMFWVMVVSLDARILNVFVFHAIWVCLHPDFDTREFGYCIIFSCKKFTTPLPPRTLPLSLRKVFLEKQWINIKQGTSEKNEPKLIQIIYKPLFPTTPCYLQSAVLQPDFSISESKARQKLIFSYKTGNWKVTIVHDERPRCIRRLINFKVYLKF